MYAIPQNYSYSTTSKRDGVKWEAKYRGNLIASGETDHYRDAHELAREAIANHRADAEEAETESAVQTRREFEAALTH